MATLEERIRVLEAEIADYRQDYARTTPEDKRLLLPTITSSGNNLHDLNQQLQQQGEVIYLPSRLSI